MRGSWARLANMESFARAETSGEGRDVDLREEDARDRDRDDRDRDRSMRKARRKASLRRAVFGEG